jgi:L-threonylcarbamoyladenylate synthase
MPRHVLALALIELAGVPIAAPSANASTKPSPTAAEHVLHDLDGRIDTIIDGGPCDVGVESTVVDGLSDLPLILRPGGISLEQLRACPGWENTQIGYKNLAETESSPKAPGMKYRHYSPNASVVLYPAGSAFPDVADLRRHAGNGLRLGVITTRSWPIDLTAGPDVVRHEVDYELRPEQRSNMNERRGFAGMLEALRSTPDPRAIMHAHRVLSGNDETSDLIFLEIALGPGVANIARGMFSALRELDRENVGAIVVEGIDDSDGETAAAIMNRLRKAAETTAET